MDIKDPAYQNMEDDTLVEESKKLDLDSELVEEVGQELKKLDLDRELVEEVGQELKKLDLDRELVEEVGQESKKLDLDRVLIEEVGEFGRYQLKMLAISVIFVITLTLITDEYLFTTARIRTRCFIPQCENASNMDNFVPAWLAHALPISDDGIGFDNCRRYAFTYNTTITLSSTDDFCPANIFNSNSTVPCEEFVYENTNTAVYDFDLACDEWRRSMVGSLRTIGTLIANPLTGLVSDRWGRRTALAVNVLGAGWLGLARYWTKSYVTFVFTELCECIFAGGFYACIFILLLETVGPKYRVMMGAVNSTIIVLGHSAVACIAWVVPNWRHLTLILYTFQLLIFPLIWLMADSIRWYTSKGKFEKAVGVLNDMAHTNGKELSTKTLLALKWSMKFERMQISKQKQDKEMWLIVQVFRCKPMLLRCVVTPVLWISLTLVYYSLTIHLVTMITAGKFSNFLFTSLSEIPGYWAAVFLVNRVGRKPVLIGAYWICALALISYVLLPAGSNILHLTMCMVGKCSMATVMTALYLYTAELFPTESRHRFFAFASTVGIIGSILAPLTPAIGGNIAFLMFSCLSLLAGLLVMLTPETLGCKLPDTMEEAAELGKTRHYS